MNLHRENFLVHGFAGSIPFSDNLRKQKRRRSVLRNSIIAIITGKRVLVRSVCKMPAAISAKLSFRNIIFSMSPYKLQEKRAVFLLLPVVENAVPGHNRRFGCGVRIRHAVHSGWCNRQPPYHFRTAVPSANCAAENRLYATACFSQQGYWLWLCSAAGSFLLCRQQENPPAISGITLLPVLPLRSNESSCPPPFQIQQPPTTL